MKKLLYLSFVFAVMTAFGFAQDGTTDIDKQIAVYSEAIKNNPNDAEAYVERGYVYYFKEDYDRAIADYSEAIRLKPNNAEAYELRGYAYEQKGDYDKAIADYSESIRIAPDRPSAYMSRGSAYFKKGDYTKAIADLSEAITRGSSNLDAYWFRAYAYDQTKNYDAAIADCNTVIKKAPDFPLVYVVRGNAYGAKGVYHKAAADYRTSLEKGIDPSGVTVDRSSKADMWFCGALYMEIVVNRFVGKPDVVGKYETWLKTVCDTNKLSRADVEAYFRQNIGALVAETVNEEFNRVSIPLYRYDAMLIRTDNNQYVLSYKDVKDVVKELVPAPLETLLATMRRTSGFETKDVDTVRSQAALIPAVVYANWKQQAVAGGVDALNLVKETLTRFYLEPGQNTYNAILGIYARYHQLVTRNHDPFASAAGNSLRGVIGTLSIEINKRLSSDILRGNPAAFARVPNDARYSIFATLYE